MPLPPPSPSEPLWRSGPRFAPIGVIKGSRFLDIPQASEDDLEHLPRIPIEPPELIAEKPDTSVLSEATRALLRRLR